MGRQGALGAMPLTLRPCIARIYEDASANTAIGAALVLVDHRDRQGSRRGNARLRGDARGRDGGIRDRAAGGAARTISVDLRPCTH
jgi:hypothetical protein